jgi:methylenetetrahydrofolate--tRNA-(uracil-5-)-methyltransferase
MKSISVIGAGLAGSEAAWQIAKAGYFVNLFEMRPQHKTGAHVSGEFAELVCSNSLGSNLRNKPSGELKQELNMLCSLLIDCAEKAALPAGSALAVDRDLFAQKVTQVLSSHPNIKIHREEVTEIPSEPVIIATGPLTSDSLSKSIQQFTGQDNLYFYDAISPTVEISSINMGIAFKASRYKFEQEEIGDYINCPLDEEEYKIFVSELLAAKTIALQDFEDQLATGVKTSFFEACLPIEILAKRNPLSLAFGPMRPVGIHNPHTDEKPRAVVQLRQENLAGTEFNMVGFQTNLTYSEQARVFRMIPGLENAEFTRYGQMHRNTYINSPACLDATMQTRSRSDLFFAGQIAGIEGYVGNIASGLVAGLNAVRFLEGKPLLIFPAETLLGALHASICREDKKNFQPVKANFGLLPPIPQLPQSKPERGFVYSKRALKSLQNFIDENGLNT